MKYIIILLTILSTINLFSEEFKIWERQFGGVDGLRQADFAGAEDEFIIAYEYHILYRINTETSEILDSLYFGNSILGTIVSKDGLVYYVSVNEKLYLYDVNTMRIMDSIPPPKISEFAPSDAYIGIAELNLSEDNKLITFRYSERRPNDYEHFEFVVYDLEQRKVIIRVGDESRNYRSKFYNPTFTPNAETLLVYTYIPPFNGNEREYHLWFYDISNQIFLDIGEKNQYKDKLTNHSKFTFLNDNEVHISDSRLPNAYGFNVLNLKTGITESLFNFNEIIDYDETTKPNRISEKLYLIGIYNRSINQMSFNLFDIDVRDTLRGFYVYPVGLPVVSKSLNHVLGYGNYHLSLYNLSDYLNTTSVQETELYSGIKISPNPSQDRNYTLEFNSQNELSIDLKLYNMMGQEIFSIGQNNYLHSGNNSIDFNIPNDLPSGQYFLRIESERGSQDVKIQL